MRTVMLVLTLLLGGLALTCTFVHSGPAGAVKPENLRTATLAGGCFWCVEADFEKVDGVVEVISGYTGGSGANPTYDDYARKGHVEAVQVVYDAAKISYEQLLEVFWRHVDPTDAGGQFVDRGPQYRTVIFYHDDEQRRLAEKSKEALEKSGRFKKPIITYKYYRYNSGRDQFLQEVWGK
jgi:peptide methionine sulfoxide reductase msrA/msrB